MNERKKKKEKKKKKKPKNLSKENNRCYLSYRSTTTMQALSGYRRQRCWKRRRRKRRRRRGKRVPRKAKSETNKWMRQRRILELLSTCRIHCARCERWKTEVRVQREPNTNKFSTLLIFNLLRVFIRSLNHWRLSANPCVAHIHTHILNWTRNRTESRFDK